MTEQQIREMVREVGVEGEATTDYRNWNIKFFFTPKRSMCGYEAYRLYRDGAELIEVIGQRGTSPDAIRAAIAMIDRLETALQEDA